MRQARLFGIEIVTLALVVGLLLMDDANRETAERHAAGTLTAFRVPPGAREEPNFPSDVQALLRAGEMEMTDSRIVKRHEDWLVPGEPQAVLRWLVRHQGPGWKRDGGGIFGYGSPEGQSFSAYLYSRREVAGLFAKDLLITLTRLPGHQTAVRAEAQTVWLRPRSPAERVPAGARFMTVSVERGGERLRSISSSNAALVRRVAKQINDLQVVQIQRPSCGPELPPGTVSKDVRFEFRAEPGSPLLAAATQEVPAGICSPLLLEVLGKTAAPLEDGMRVVRSVRGLIKRMNE